MNVEPSIESEVSPPNTSDARTELKGGPNRSALLFNRISLLLSFIGIFVAGVLSLGHALALSVPCGESGGCDVVAGSKASFIFGIPVAYLGLGAYILLAAISSIRAVRGFYATRFLGYAALVVSGVGAVFSLYLQFISFTEIHAYCLWCIASAIAMALLFLVQAGLAQIEVQPDSGSHRDVAFTVGLGMVAVIAIAANSMTLARQAPKLDGSQANIIRQLVTPDSITYGKPEAPIKIIEFSDLLCSSCRAVYPDVKQVVDRSNGKVQLIFRHYPLFKKVGHQMALPAAFVAEYANEKGKAWQFIEKIYNVDPYDLADVQSVLGVAQMVGLDVADVQSRMKDSDPGYQRVTRDIATGKEAGINSTPTFVIIAPGQPAKAMLGHEVLSVIKQPAYQNIIKGNGS
jgi:protein-disulfide isomerase